MHINNTLNLKEILLIGKQEKNTRYIQKYIVDIIKEENKVLIGIPEDDRYDRIRVNIENYEAKLYKSKNKKVILKELKDINHNIPESRWDK